jgi:uncharacterized transporter YbjL
VVDRVKIGSFSLGGSTGSLLAGLLIGGLIAPPVNATAKSVLFMLFLFGIGYTVGPKFEGDERRWLAIRGKPRASWPKPSTGPHTASPERR